MSNISNVSMEEVFKKCGVDYREMDELSEVDVSDKCIKILGYNEKQNENSFYKILRLVRKKNAQMYVVEYPDITHPLKITEEHKFLTPKGYVKVKDLPDTFTVLKENRQYVKVQKSRLNEEYPVLDITVDKIENYYTNNILSHNSPETVSGGKALKFYTSTRLEVRRVESISEGKADNIIGIKSRVKAVKNKVAPPYRKTEINIYFDKGIDRMSSYVDFAVQYKIIEKAASWFTVNGERLQGKSNVVQYFKDNLDVFEDIKQKVNAQLNHTNINGEKVEEENETTEEQQDNVE